MAKIPNIKSTNNYFERTETLVKYYHDVLEYDVVNAETEKELFTLLSEGKKNLKKAKEEHNYELALKYEKEVKKLRDFIINSNLRFAISIARVYANNNNILDVINEGNIGLIEAVDTFDVSMGNRFQTHAVYLIRQKINLFKQNGNLLIRKNNESKTYHIISNMTNKFIQEFNREPTADELKDYINKHYPNAKLKNSRDVVSVKIASIDEPIDDDENDVNIYNINSFNEHSASYNDYESKIENEKLSAIATTLMRNLTDREKTIIKMYFGIGCPDNSPAMLSEIAETVGLTKERVRQLIESIINKLKKEYSENLFML